MSSKICWVVIVAVFLGCYFLTVTRSTKNSVYVESLTGIGPAFLGALIGGGVSTVLYGIFRLLGWMSA
jgi:hypothetical protein